MCFRNKNFRVRKEYLYLNLLRKSVESPLLVTFWQRLLWAHSCSSIRQNGHREVLSVSHKESLNCWKPDLQTRWTILRDDSVLVSFSSQIKRASVQTCAVADHLLRGHSSSVLQGVLNVQQHFVRGSCHWLCCCISTERQRKDRTSIWTGLGSGTLHETIFNSYLEAYPVPYHGFYIKNRISTKLLLKESHLNQSYCKHSSSSVTVMSRF